MAIKIHVDFGLSQWGLKQQPNESYVDYVKRVKDSKLWQTKDNGFYDLTREGATNLNRQTSLNPNIVYKTYTGESTRIIIWTSKSDLILFFPFTLTANVIGKAAEKEWRENDGLVSVISSQHPFNQAYTQATDTNQKGFGKLHQRNMIGIMSILLVKTVLTQNALELNYNNFGMT